MNNFLISVIIPMYNVDNYIEKCLTSLFKNKHAIDCEFILINDYSTDRTLDITYSIIQKYPNLYIKIINHSKNQGIAITRNTGMLNSTGKYILYVDSDDFVEYEYIDSFYEIAISNDYDFIECGYNIVCNNYSKSLIPKIELLSPLQYLSNVVSDKFKSYLWCRLFKREIIISNNINFIQNLNHREDYIFCIQFFSHFNSYYVINKSLYNYVQRKDSNVHQSISYQKINNIIDAINFSESYLNKIISKEDINNSITKSFLEIKLKTKYYSILMSPYSIQKKYFTIWPEIYDIIENSSYGKITKITLKKISKKNGLSFLWIVIHSFYLIIKKELSFSYYLKGVN